MDTLQISKVGTTGSVPLSFAAQAGSAQQSSSFSKLFSAAQQSTNLDTVFEKASQAYGVPTALLKAVAKAESNFDPNAQSSAGAQGVMQLMPGTARSLGVSDSFDAEQNIMGGAKYLSQLLREFDGDTTLAVAAYNAGPGNVKKYDGVPPFAETQNYVKKVLGLSDSQLSAGTVQSAATSTADIFSALTGMTDSFPSSGSTTDPLSALTGTSADALSALTGLSASSLGASTAESYLLMRLYQFQATQALFSDSTESENLLSGLF